MKKIVMITGMMRSGTSCISNLLEQCGLDFGSNNEMIYHNRPSKYNKFGFYENMKFLKLNEKIIMAAGGSFIRFPDQIVIEKKIIENRDKPEDFVNEYSGDAVKSNRICLLFNLWRDYCKCLIICFRHPWSCANSFLKLYSRSKFTFEYALKLWYEYNTRILNSIGDFEKVLFINYDDIYKNLKSKLIKITPNIDDKIVDNFYKEELNHNLYKHTILNGVVMDVYNKIIKISEVN